MSNLHPVSITLNGVVKMYSVEFQTAQHYSHGWRAVLKGAYRRAEVRCGCSGRGSKRLAVKHYEDTDQFALAKFGLSGAEHAPNCQFHSANPSQAAISAGTASVVAPLPDGTVSIRLEIGMIERDELASFSPKSAARAQSVRSQSEKRPAMKLLGLLHYLWDSAALNQWKPGFAEKRRPSLVYWMIQNAADEIWLGNTKLAKQVLLPAFSASTREAARNRELAATAIDSKRRMLLVAPLAIFNEERSALMEQQLKVGGFHGVPVVYMPNELWKTTVQRFPTAAAAWRNGHSVIAIVQIELRPGKSNVYARAIDLALMAVTPEFIPVESSYERTVATALVAQQRTFSKPLLFDSNADQVLPDFILTDTEQPVPLEVFGRMDD